MVALLGSTPRPVLPAVTWAAFKIVAHKSMGRQDATDLLLPATLRNDGARPESASVAIDALVDLGFLVEREDRLHVSPKVEGDLHDEHWFRREIRRRVLTPARNKDLLESDEGTRELTKALAWFLAQPVDNPPVSYERRSKAETNSVTQLMNEQFRSDQGARSILQSSSRWSPFVRWGTYMGLIGFLPMKDGGPCPDPTVAVREALGELGDKLTGETELPRVIAALAKEIPVLDGGSYRKLVEGLMDNKPASCGDSKTVSASLSLALLRLRDEGVVDLRRPSDSPATRTLSVRPDHRLAYSHVVIMRSTEVVA